MGGVTSSGDLAVGTGMILAAFGEALGLAALGLGLGLAAGARRFGGGGISFLGTGFWEGGGAFLFLVTPGWPAAPLKLEKRPLMMMWFNCRAISPLFCICAGTASWSKKMAKRPGSFGGGAGRTAGAGRLAYCGRT